MEAYTGEILLFAFDWVPQDCLPCDGRIVAINQYQALFTVVWNKTGQDTFQLPDLAQTAPSGTAYRICSLGVYPLRK
jgi:microcystin-dependent protein